MKRKTSLQLTLCLTTLLAATASADTVAWTGLGADPNWSTGNNWTNETAGTSGIAPGTADDVQFPNSGFSGPNVDAAFGGTIGSLWFTAATEDYMTTLATALNITGPGGLRAGTNAGASVVRTLTISGSTLNVSNAAANLVVNQSASSGAGDKATLNLEGLDSFNADLDGLGIGSGNFPTVINDRCSGDLYLARTNLIALHFSQPLATYETTAARNALEIGHNPGNNPGTRNFLYLGITNAFFLDSIGIGKSKASTAAACTMLFNPNFLGSAPAAYFRGTAGDASRVTWWALGDMSSSASSAQVAYGTNDFTGGWVDALVDTMSLGRDCVPNHSAGGNARYNIGVLSFDNGIIDVNTLYLGNQVLGPGTSTTPNHGYLSVNSANATLVVNNTLMLARTTQNSTAAQQTFGRINVNGGTLRANTITVGSGTVTNAVIDLSNSATFVLSNTLASAAKPLRTLNTADATLTLNLTGAPAVGYVTNLLTDGSANTINIGSSIVFASYPAQVALFKYSVLSNATSGDGTHNFTLGSVPASVVNAYLTNNTFNSSLDLFLPVDPRPVITNEPSGFSGPPGSIVQLSAGASGVGTLQFQWRRDSTNISDAGNWSGTATDTLTINAAQTADSGSYTVVISNSFGVTTSIVASVTISAGNVAPGLTGPNDTSVLQGETALLTASASGVPAPVLQWFKNGTPLTGETGASLGIVSAQHPADEAIYSLRATNVAGVASNWAKLTVVVPPGIATEPTVVTVPNGSPAAFNVVATGNPSPSYQWSKNNTAIENATNATLAFTSVTPADAGNYAVLISNAGGSTNSQTVKLTVTSTTLAHTNLSPANSAADICYDTLLRIQFNQPPALGSGQIRIYDSTDTLVDTIDLAANNGAGAQAYVIGGNTYSAYPVIIGGTTATIYPHPNLLTSNSTYYVIIEPGVFRDAVNASHSGISSPTAWRFTTKVAGPDSLSATNVTVAADGSGDFATVQGAIDWVPANNTIPIQVDIKKGVYEQINRINGKNNVRFQGESCAETILTYRNNDALNGGTTLRVMFFAGGNDHVFANLTLSNSTPQGGSQAEALRVQGGRIILDNCKLASFQDTILINTANTSAGYFNKCLIQGDVDFIWGSGIGFFDKCEVRAMQRPGNGGGVYTQARSAPGVYGLIFRDCDLTKSVPSVTNNWTLGRDGGNGNPNGNVAWLNCRMDDHISAAGWTDGGLADKSTLRFWEYLSRDLTDTTYVPTNARVPWSLQLDAATAETAANPTNVFASIFWEPVLAPYVACQPVGQSALTGQTVTISAAVGGIPQPVYQWYQGVAPVLNGTNENLVIANAQAGAAGTYSLRATNDLGFVISSNVVLTVTSPTPPSISSPARLENGNFQFSFSGGSGQPYRVWASANVGLVPVSGTWTLLGSGAFGGSAIPFVDTNAAGFAQRYYIITVP